MKKTTIIIDSSQRASIYTSNNRFVYPLKTVYQNIRRVKLIGTIIANSQYIINANNRTITVNRSGTDYTFNLTQGNYTPSALATELQTQLNTNVFGGAFAITQSSTTNKFRLQCTVAVTYKFASNPSLGRILGFGGTDTTATTDVYSTNCFQVNTTRFYKVLIKEIANDVDTNIQPLAFTFIIPNGVNSGEYNYLSPFNNINNDIDEPQLGILS